MPSRSPPPTTTTRMVVHRQSYGYGFMTRAPRDEIRFNIVAPLFSSRDAMYETGEKRIIEIICFRWELNRWTPCSNSARTLLSTISCYRRTRTVSTFSSNAKHGIIIIHRSLNGRFGRGYKCSRGLFLFIGVFTCISILYLLYAIWNVTTKFGYKQIFWYCMLFFLFS